MTIYNTSNIWEALDGYPFTHIRLENEVGKMIIPFPSRTVTKENRIKEIKKFFASDHNSDGFYNIIVKSGANGEKTFFKVQKGKPADEPKPIQDKIIVREVAAEKSDLMTDGDILEMRVENERLRMEIERLEDQIANLENELNEQQELSDGPSSPMLPDWLKDVAPALADSYFSLKKEAIANDRAKIEIEQAKLGLMYQQQQQPKPPKNVKREREDLTFEELEEARQQNPQAFYTWMSENTNAEHYEELKNNYYAE